MVSLSTPKHFRTVQDLPFCYVCGKDFVPGDITDRDHVPAKKAFRVRDRDPALWLPAHKNCNGAHSTTDQKLAHLIGVRWGRPLSVRDRQLDIRVFGPGIAAVLNLNIDAAIMRWVRGFHSALYREWVGVESLPCSVVSPFPTAKRAPVTTIKPILSQHLAFVQTIKEQRALRNVDAITSNNRKVTYECVWTQTDQRDIWFCVFALNFYDWKDLGRVPGQPLRGCSGMYFRGDRLPPPTASRAQRPSIIIPNLDRLDPFAA